MPALPPVPLRDIKDLPYTFQEWLRSVQNLVSTGSFSWALLNFSGSNLTDIATRNHNDLQTVQGGGVGDYYHLTGVQATDLTDGGNSTLHFHSADRSDSFRTIAVSGQSDVVADSQTDTLTLVGSGVTITTNASTDTITLTVPTVASGTYTPTLTNTTNLAASTAYQCQYLRVDNTVTVSGRVDVDPTGAGQTVLGISLPIASNIGATEDVGGVASTIAVASQCAGIYGDTANDRATMEWVAVDLANRAMFFTFSYQVI